MNSYREELLRFAKETFGTQPEYLWEKTPDCCVLRHKDNRKWYGVFLNGPKQTLGLRGRDRIDMLNVKVDPFTGSLLRQETGFFPAYHMNKDHWVTILLDGTVEFLRICDLLQDSFYLTGQKSS